MVIPKGPVPEIRTGPPSISFAKQPIVAENTLGTGTGRQALAQSLIVNDLLSLELFC